MPKYKVDFRIVRILGNKVDSERQPQQIVILSHFRYQGKPDMITKLICQLPDHDAFGRRGQLSFGSSKSQRPWLGRQRRKSINLTPSHVVDPPEKKAEKSPNEVKTKNYKHS